MAGGSMKLTEKAVGSANVESYVLVTQKELPSDYVITGNEEEGELDAMKIESVRRIPTAQMVEMIQENLDVDDEPTDESDALITSGSVKAELDRIDEALDSYNEDITNISTAESEDIGKALSPKTVTDGKVTEWQFKSLGGGGGGGTSDYSDLDNKPKINSITLTGNKSLADIGAASASDVGIIAAKVGKMDVALNMADLESTTASRVLVLNNDSPYGDGAQCIFEVQEGRTSRGYARTNGTRVYPIADQGVLPIANAPWHELMAIIKTWVGRTNIIHSTTYPDTTNLFGADCAADENNKFHMDCSDFISAVLLGITYDNSRFVLGASKENIQLEHTGIVMPASTDPEKLKGGLNTAELGQWFAEQGRLFRSPTTGKEAAQIFQFGDILFGCDDESAGYRYYSMTHCMFILGTIPAIGGERLVVVHCNSAIEGQERQAIRTQLLNPESYTGRYFARPCYKTPLHQDQLIPKGDGAFTYNLKYLMCCEAKLSASGDIPAGTLGRTQYKACTPDFYRAIPNAVITYTGATHTSDNINYLMRVTEYDKSYAQVKRGTTILSSGTASPLTLSATTQYVRFTFGISDSSSRFLWLSDLDDCELTVTPPSGS